MVWVGRDDNKPTGLYGSTGALKVWIDLFKKLPAEPLAQPTDGIEFVWIDPDSGESTDPVCSGARELPFVSGYAPSKRHGCALDKIREWLGRGED